MSNGERIKRWISRNQARLLSSKGTIWRWISKNKTALFVAASGLVLAVIGSLLLAPNLKETCIQVGCQILNIAVLLCLTFGLLMIVVALCWHTRGSWIIPLVCIVFLGLIVFGICLFLAFGRTVRTPQETQTLLTATGITLGVFGAGAAAIGVFFGRKIEKLIEIEKRANEVSTLTVIAAELAFANLPDFTESQQIPEDSRKVLRDITRDIFGQDKTLLKFLDNRGNGLRLRYARGLALFADGVGPEARWFLNEVVNKARGWVDIKSRAMHRLGIAYRQDQFYGNSLECFLEMAKNNRGNQHYRYFEDIAKIGTAITLRAMWKDNDGHERWEIMSDKRKTKLLEDLEEVFGKLVRSTVIPPIKNWAFKLVSDVWRNQQNNPLVSGYMAKIYKEDLQQNFPQQPLAIQKALDTVIEYVSHSVYEQSLNIKANYFSALGFCYSYKNLVQKAKKAWKLAIEAAMYYRDTCEKKARIYSEIKEREIPVLEFKDEVKTLLLRV